MFKLQTSFFGGDCTMLDDTGTTFNTLDEAVAHLLANSPPDEFEWRVDEGGRMVAWTRYAGVEVSYWRPETKVVTVRDKTGKMNA